MARRPESPVLACGSVLSFHRDARGVGRLRPFATPCYTRSIWPVRRSFFWRQNEWVEGLFPSFIKAERARGGRIDSIHGVPRFVGELPASQRQADLLRRALGLFGLALVAATWRLWTAQHVFPQVPFFYVMDGVPDACQWAGAAAMILGLAGAALAPGGSRRAPGSLLLFAVATLVMILLDQQRLQPWAYQFVLAAVVLALADARGALPLLRLLVISFYFHSAVTKFDHSFLHTLGQQFLGALAGASLDGWSESVRVAAAAVFPVGELLVAITLCFARTRTAGLAGAVLLHVLLLAILGPWGLDHKPGVLLWNGYFIAQDILLFSRGQAQPAADPAGKAVAPWPVRAMIWAAALLPFLGPTTWFDMWPSWGLYASAAQRVQLLVHRRELEQLPQELRQVTVASSEADDPWLTVRLDRWALAALGAPIYPQSRSQLGVAEAVIVRYGLVHRVRLYRFDLADRWSGQREYELFTTLPKILAASGEYLFNSRPRQGRFAPRGEKPAT